MYRPASFVSSLTVTLLSLMGQFSVPVYADIPAKSDMYESCEAGEGGAALFVQVQNIRSIEGNLRAQVYSNEPEDFLEKGKRLVRVDVPVKTVEEQGVCVPMPAPGTYAVVVMHDRNANGKADFFSEGFGFSNNPKLNFGPPDVEDTLIKVLAGVGKTTVRLKYLLDADEKKNKKRRKLNRR